MLWIDWFLLGHWCPFWGSSFESNRRFLKDLFGKDQNQDLCSWYPAMKRGASHVFFLQQATYKQVQESETFERCFNKKILLQPSKSSTLHQNSWCCWLNLFLWSEGCFKIATLFLLPRFFYRFPGSSQTRFLENLKVAQPATNRFVSIDLGQIHSDQTFSPAGNSPQMVVTKARGISQKYPMIFQVAWDESYVRSLKEPQNPQNCYKVVRV